MKEWVEFSKCVGKTIAGQVIDGHEPDRWLIAFTDGTWSSIEWGLPGYPEGEMQLQSERPPFTEHVAGLKILGLIDQNEADSLLKQREAERQAKLESAERAEYERLHAKFGKGEA